MTALSADIVAAIRAPDRTVLGFVGDSVLIERIGKRLSTIEFSDRFVFQVLDQNGAALFANDFKPNPRADFTPESGELLNKIRPKQEWTLRISQQPLFLQPHRIDWLGGISGATALRGLQTGS